jgi:phytoene dehydrogenase-like protein
MSRVKIRLPIFILVALLCAESAFAQGARRSISCDVVIVGGGAGGLHTAFRLAPTLGNQVCLFEKEAQLGGRILDVSLTPGGPVFGLGALRIMETQDVLFDLADELGIAYVAMPYDDDWISARGLFATNSDDLLSRYPDVTQPEGELYDKLFAPASRQHENDYPDFRSYVRGTVGEESYHFLADTSRFRGDYTYPLSDV